MPGESRRLLLKVTVEEARNGGDLRQPSAVEPATEPPALEQF
jgi:hypothetical protein